MAPAPSGLLHVGGARTALYNWLYARHHDAVFILRIEDTDASRSTDEGIAAVAASLRWLGLDWDEGPEVGGAYGPYRQSQRAALYGAVARRLVERGHAYHCYCTTEELEAARREALAAGRAPVYGGRCRALSAADRATFEAEGRAATVRVLTPVDGAVTIHDEVRGEVTFAWDTIGDFIVQRADGSATYPLANTVDDVAQGVTLVCRGEDLLSVTPRQVGLYGMLVDDGVLDGALEEVGLPPRAPDWGPPSSFAHLPLIVGEDRKPLSKRHGSVAVQEFQREGFLPDVMVNYLALLGWSPGDGRERLSREELVAAFSLEHVGRTPAAFDRAKLTAFNGEAIRALVADDLAAELLPFLDGTYGEALVSAPPTASEHELLAGLVPLVQERMQRLDEVQVYAPAFFREQLEPDPASVDKVLRKAGARAVLEAAVGALESVGAWDTAAIEAALRALPERLGVGVRQALQPIRVAVTGSTVSPPLFESLALLPKDVVLARLRAAVAVAA